MSIPSSDVTASQAPRTRVRAIAFHLPQFHPIPENDQWWGKGFTEWTNVGKARPLFKGHYQPRVPADLGYYDLRIPEVRQAQADLAREYGIEAFCYWHYWFAGDRLLERPFNEILASGKPNFPFCLAWANHSWTGIWYGAPKRILKEQTYPGREDYIRHFNWLLQAFRDPRYVRVDGKPLFLFFRPSEIPDLPGLADLWRNMAVKAGLRGLHLVGIWGDGQEMAAGHGLDGATLFRVGRLLGSKMKSLQQGLARKIRRHPVTGPILNRLSPRPAEVYSYAEASRFFVEEGDIGTEYYPTAIPDFDNSPRSGMNGLILHGSTPELFREHLRKAVAVAERLPEERRLLFIKSWNEWAEGNTLEPDLKWGHGYLKALREVISR
jgi:lipopolysaccharide biosynthesis protein